MLRRQLLIVTLFVLALRLPFLNQAIQGDDVYYLYGAEHAQIDPLHPNHARYAFQGDTVDMRGHPHPPLNAWYLGGLLAVFRTVTEAPFHAAYIPFSLIAGWSALALTRRFSPRPLAATLLFLVAPCFIVNGNSLESDLPFVAFWLASIALFVAGVDRRSPGILALSCMAMGLAALAAYQAVVLVPILLLYCYLDGRHWKLAWVAAFTAPAVLVLWQIWERATSGALPAAVLAGYMQTYGLQAFAQKIKNAVALTGHLAWVTFPVLPFAAFRSVGRWAGIGIAVAIGGAAFVDANPLFWMSIGIGLLILIWCALHTEEFAAAWILIFFACALAIFFAGSARYLLPVSLPLTILLSQRLSARWMTGGVVLGAALSLALAIVNYQHWDGYRRFARDLQSEARNQRVWINGEWGLRFYLESEGGVPVLRDQPLRDGDIVVSSALAYPIQLASGGGLLTPVAAKDISSKVPLRLVALNGRSAYSTTLFGLRPFDISLGVIDRVRAERYIARRPQLSRLLTNAPESGMQIVSGLYDIENGQWRWTAQSAVVLLKSPLNPAPLSVKLYVPPKSPARQILVYVNDKLVLTEAVTAPGSYTLITAPMHPEGDSVSVRITVDKTFTVPPDRRQLGVILTEVGF